MLPASPMPLLSLEQQMDQMPNIKNNTSKTDVAPWCYKWVGGLDGYLRVGLCIDHLTVLITLLPGLGDKVAKTLLLI